jgi:hypothetical protein
LDLENDVFFTFGDGKHGWRGAKNRIVAEAIKTDFFRFHLGFDLKTLMSIDPNLKTLVEKLNDKHRRGFGYWVWKPATAYLVDLIFPENNIWYFDAGSSFNFQTDIKKALTAWKSFAVKNNGLALTLPDHPEYKWTKSEVIQLLDFPKKHIESNQIQSSFFILPPGPSRRKFLIDWIEFSQKDEGFYLTDELKQKQDPNFVEHRHDQSIFSLLWKKYEFGKLPDATYPVDGNLESPIFSTRNNTRLHYLHKATIKNAVKALDNLQDVLMKTK